VLVLQAYLEFGVADRAAFTLISHWSIGIDHTAKAWKAVVVLPSIRDTASGCGWFDSPRSPDGRRAGGSTRRPVDVERLGTVAAVALERTRNCTGPLSIARSPEALVNDRSSGISNNVLFN
jgi:hypothetical protein